MPELNSIFNPTNAIPPNIAKEWVSLSYVTSVIAQAGFNIGKCIWDDGVDMTIRSDKKYRGSTIDASAIELQLKSTQNINISDDFIKYRMDVKTYDRLRSENRQIPMLLIVYTMSKKRSDWITYKSNGNGECLSTIMNHTAYYLDLRGYPALPNNRKTTTVSIPLKNHFNKNSLSKIYREHLKESQIAIDAVKQYRASKEGSNDGN